MASGDILYPGYYPGTPFTRRPTPGGYKPPKYTGTPADDFFDALMATPPLGVARWLWMEQINSLKQDFKIHAGYTEGGAAYFAAMGEEELEDLPGAMGVSVNLNPLDWITNPGEQIKEHLTSHYKAIVDKDDFNLRAKRDLWRKDLLVKENSPYGLANSYRADRGRISDKAMVGETYDVYDEVRRTVPDFMLASKSQSSRNKVYREASMAILKGLDVELQDKQVQFTTGVHKDAARNFSKKVAVANSIGDVGGAMNKLQKELRKDALRIKKVDRRSKELVNKRVNKLWGEVENAKTRIESVKALGGKSEKEVNAYSKQINKLDRSLKRTTEIVDGKRVLKSFDEAVLDQSINVGKAKLFTKTAGGGVGGTYIRRLKDGTLRNRKSALNKAIRSGEADISEAGSRMGDVAGAIGRDWEWQTAFDLVDAFEDGKIPTQYIWMNVIRPRIERFTPGYRINKIVNEGFLAKERFGNKFKVRIGLKNVAVKGGKHFGMSLGALNKVLEADKTTGYKKNMIRLLNGNFMSSDNIFAEDQALLRKTKAWLYMNRKKLGLEFVGKKLVQNSKVNDKVLSSVLGEVKKRKIGAGVKFVDPAKAKNSLLEKYAAFLGRIQASTFGKIYNVTRRGGEMLRQKLIALAERMIENILGAATGGVGKAIAWAVRLVAAKLINKTMKLLSEFAENFKGFDLKGIEEVLEEVVEFVAKTLLFCGGSCGCVMFIIIGLLTAILSIIPGVDFTKSGGNVVGPSVVQIEEMREFEVPEE